MSEFKNLNEAWAEGKKLVRQSRAMLAVAAGVEEIGNLDATLQGINQNIQIAETALTSVNENIDTANEELASVREQGVQVRNNIKLASRDAKREEEKLINDANVKAGEILLNANKTADEIEQQSSELRIEHEKIMVEKLKEKADLQIQVDAIRDELTALQARINPGA